MATDAVVAPYMTRDGGPQRIVLKDPIEERSRIWSPLGRAFDPMVRFLFEDSDSAFRPGQVVADRLRDVLNQSCKGHWEIHSSLRYNMDDGEPPPSQVEVSTTVVRSGDKTEPWFVILFETTEDRDRAAHAIDDAFKPERGAPTDGTHRLH